MSYYVIQVVTGKEESVIDSLPGINLICPLRKMIINRKGKKLTETKPIFPGYIFLETDKLENSIIDKIKNTPYILRILNSYQDPKILQKHELEPIKKLLNPNFKPEISNIKFDENDKIVVINGPLKDLEGRIIRVDKRKQRATVQVDMYDKSHKIDFSYVDISK